MARVETRRYSNPTVARGFHDAIIKTQEQKQCPIFERLFKALLIDGYKVSRKEAENQLKLTVKDGIVAEVKATSNHGQNKGKHQTAYRLVDMEDFESDHPRDDHDWYCWDCHREGEVVLCSRCPRVFHKKCLGYGVMSALQRQFVCKVCKAADSAQPYSTSRKEMSELAMMLQFSLNRMKDKADELYHPVSEEKEPYYSMFVYHPVHFKELEQRVARKEFTNLKSFVSEVEWMYHNAVIYYSDEDPITDMARTTISDGKYELSQIEICADCYMMSNKRPENWFSIPCKFPHDIVYAKLGGDPPWPAKILRRNEDRSAVDVRFFGPPHQRAWIPSKNVFEMNCKPVVKKRSKAWLQAELELQEHLKLLREKKIKLDFLEEPQNGETHQTETTEKKSKKKRGKLEKSVSSSTDTSETVQDPELSDEIQRTNGGLSMDSMKMTDDYKIIEKLQNQLSVAEATLQETRAELETEKLTNEQQKQELEKCKRESEEAITKLREELESKRDRDVSDAIETERLEVERNVNERIAEAVENVRNESKQMLEETIQKEKNAAEQNLQEQITQERLQADSRIQRLKQQDREEFQRNLDALRRESELGKKIAVDEAVRKTKLEADEFNKRMVAENLRRAQLETDRIVREAIGATKKKSWCSNCGSEAFYHCCWNTNYCSTDCQRVHWANHRYQCTRDLVNTCRSCQQRQPGFGAAPPPNYPVGPSPQGPPK